MAISRRGNATQAKNASTTSLACPAFSSDPITGDTVVVFTSSWVAGGMTHQAPTDSQSNAYTQVGTTQSSVSTDFQLSEWRAENITGGSSFVVTGHCPTLATLTVIAICLTGANTPTSYNGDTVAATATSTNPATGSSSPAPAANSYFLAAVTKGATTIPTAGSGWQFFTNSTQTDNVSFQDLYVEESTATSSSAMNGQFTMGVSENWLARVSSFAPSAPVTLEQEGFRWRNDDGSETTATWQAAQDTNVTVVPDQTTRLRMLVNTTGDVPNEQYKLQYRKVGDPGWRDIDTSG